MRPNTWVKLHRKTLDNYIFRHDRTAWHVFETLLIIANQDGEWSGGLFQLAQLCEESKPTIYKAIKRLEKAGMINRLVNGRFSVYNILKWHYYQGASKQPVNSQQTPGNTLIRIENKNTNVNVSKAEAYGSDEINSIFDYWQEAVGYAIVSRRDANRRAAYNLIRKHGDDGLRRLIKGVAAAQADRYAPRISDFAQLQQKQNDLIAWGQQRARKGNIRRV